MSILSFALRAICIIFSIISACTYTNGLSFLTQIQPSHRETHGIDLRLSPLWTPQRTEKKRVHIFWCVQITIMLSDSSLLLGFLAVNQG